MKFEIVKVTWPLELGEYDEQLRGQILRVWVNPPQEVRAARMAVLGEFRKLLAGSVSTATAAGTDSHAVRRATFSIFKRWTAVPNDTAIHGLKRRIYVWLSEILSQGENPCAADELERLFEADVVLYEWILKRAVEMIEQFRVEKKSPSSLPLRS